MLDQIRSTRHRFNAAWVHAKKRKEKSSDLYFIYIGLEKKTSLVVHEKTLLSVVHSSSYSSDVYQCSANICLASK